MSHLTSLLKRLLVNETSSGEEKVEKKNTYIFEVDIKANKIQIRQALEKAFDLKGKIYKLRTSIRAGKKKRVGRHKSGYTPDRKRAILTLKPGNEIAEI
jgi:large subunit ribosomal protein L23